MLYVVTVYNHQIKLGPGCTFGGMYVPCVYWNRIRPRALVWNQQTKTSSCTFGGIIMCTLYNFTRTPGNSYRRGVGSLLLCPLLFVWRLSPEHYQLVPFACWFSQLLVLNKTFDSSGFIVQELCESRGGRLGLSVLTSLLVSVGVKLYLTMLRHWSQLVPNMSTGIWGH